MTRTLRILSTDTRQSDQAREEPLRSELLSGEKLDEFARSLATTQVVSTAEPGRNLLTRLEDNKEELEEAYTVLAESTALGQSVSPAAEWLVDNFHVVQEQLREIREDLPPSYYRELPKLKNGELAGFPRVYAIALELIAHTDSRIEADALRRFVAAYQDVAPLSIGEVWAMAISLRLGLVENLRRLAISAVANRDQRTLADDLAERLFRLASVRPDDAVAFLSNQAGGQGPLNSVFVVELFHRLRDQDIGVAPVLEWLERRLSEDGRPLSQIVSSEHQRQAENQITVANIITSMRSLSALDWEEFFESVSLVERALSEDPAEVYRSMDFRTRDRYRHVVERISKATRLSELEVSRHVLSLAGRGADTGSSERVRGHVGYYLVDDGVRELERICGYRPRVTERLQRVILAHATGFYLCAFGLSTISLALVAIHYTLPPSANMSLWVLAVALSLIPASEMALSILNWLVTTVIKPRILPRMDTTSGIPANATTMVVIPTMLSDSAAVDELLEKIEVLYLANEDENIYFALLSDYSDWSSESKSDDEMLLDAAVQGIARLNERHPTDSSLPRFQLFHRRRLFNPGENKWIGWERKRGKLHEFNRLLRGDTNTSFLMVTAEPATLRQIRYVITLDTDTQLPRNCARKLVATILHPLNQPEFDPELRRVTRGYGILQPRVGVSLASASRSRFALAFSGSTGIDPYTTAVSDVYQDMFGEGSYTGKGLYDVDAFEAALDGRIPENSLLSHDLFEGLFARTALVTDIEVLDDYPSQYDAYASRLHRWIRGDWQVARWLFPHVRDARRNLIHNSLSSISLWKIVDNLRRSLVAPAVMLWLLASWTVLPGFPLFWTLLALLMIVFPIYAQATTTLMQRQRGVKWSVHLETVWNSLGVNARRTALTMVFFADRSILSLDAVWRTVWRMLVTRRHLLEWVTAAQTGRESAATHGAFWRSMKITPVVAAISAIAVFLIDPRSLIVAGPFLGLWFFSPSIAYWTSRPPLPEPGQLGREDIKKCRLLARRTWRYFETFVGEGDHWLPPDNFQEIPNPTVAHRTSPTNVGLLLLATTAAHDFGYTATLELIERLELTFATFEKLPRYRGHFFNWYDTRTLEPLAPQYISTVDSGNLAGHLIAVKQACVELCDQPVFQQRCVDGLRDTAAMLYVEAGRIVSIPERTPGFRTSQLLQEVEQVNGLLKNDLRTLPKWNQLLESLGTKMAIVEDMTNALVDEHGENDFGELRFWAAALSHQVHSYSRDLETLTPWTVGSLDQLAVGAGSQISEIASRFIQRNQVAPTPSQVVDQSASVIAELQLLEESIDSTRLPTAQRESLLAEVRTLRISTEKARQAASSLLVRATTLAQLIDRFVGEMDFGFLFDESRHVLTIGYNVTEGRRDNSFYDLLASEARLGSFVAIATGDVPTDHWFRLGRQLAAVGGRRALISWTASMFEYLMPLLVMRSYDGTLLDETYRTIVERQIEYGKERRVPWGISESAFNARDFHLNYQYGPFGVPGLGLKRGLSEDLVVAPYATLLAALINPELAAENLSRLEREGAVGRYGLYEAIDYTPDRVPQQRPRVIVQAFMSHHQGMNIVALDNVLNGRIVQRRFHSEPVVQATELLLQERLPRGVPTYRPRAEEVAASRKTGRVAEPPARRYRLDDLVTPQTHLLSNGTYSTMITTAGSGLSKCGGLAINRWFEDATRDNWGFYCYLRDVRSGAVWSAGFQPTLRQPHSYETVFSEDRAEISREDVGLVTRTEVIISQEDNAELRRISVSNRSTRVREVELTSYLEIVLASRESDGAHRAFSNLFVETEVVGDGDGLLAHRRARSETREPVWCAHVMAVEGETVGPPQCETDRGRFIGRGRTTAEPMVIVEDRPLSGTVGAVLDPILSLRRRLLIRPNETVRVCFTVGVATSRDAALDLAHRYRDPSIFERETTLAWTRSRVELRHLNIKPAEAHVFQRLAARVLYSDARLRAPGWVLSKSTKSQSGLWAHGISGDLPIVMVRVADEEEVHFVARMFRAYGYWRLKGFAVDLVILNEHSASYLQTLQDEIQALARRSGLHQSVEKREGVYLLRADLITVEDRLLLLAASRVILAAERGSLEAQLARGSVAPLLPATFIPRWPRRIYQEPDKPARRLAFQNGLGGFSADGREYVITLGDKQWTPAPWVNIVSNPAGFGFLVTETGAACTWSANSRENRLTPWSNDVVSDPSGEVIYIRDEDSGSFWTATPLPIREASAYTIRHGQGYTVFEHFSHGISQELTEFVAIDADVKLSILRLTNTTDRVRRLSITAYYELVLGERGEKTAPFIVTTIDKETGAVTAQNHYNADFRKRQTYVAMSRQSSAVTCDRHEFIGASGTLARPAAMTRTTLSGRTGAGLDPCIAVQSQIEIAPHQTAKVVVLLGQSESIDEIRATVTRFSEFENAEHALEAVSDYWQDVVDTVQVHTPDPALDVMINRWLLYQVLSCRVLARSGFYQPGGAYGFRDQLQDVMALVYARPDLTRDQILRAAGRQFKEGDVQHWWHPPVGRGLRTRISDDAVWLPFVTAFYVEKTGDQSILDQEVTYIEGRGLAAEEMESYNEPVESVESASLYDHCLKAIETSVATGSHGLPLIRTGDWNDGMNRVGPEGRGESVWLGWFLYATLDSFHRICRMRGNEELSEKFQARMTSLRRALEEHGWDGDWYRRAYFDDGTPLGSSANQECRIDSISQSWSVISQAADHDRAALAMKSVDEHLVRRRDDLVLLLWPPFDRSSLEPGYIKGYVPGIRENGGQYSHAAMWALTAFAMLGDGDKVGELVTMLNPISHSSTRAGAHRYKVEPYVVAGDVYSVTPHAGRGGWTWYTGAAGWMYRAVVESVLGFKLKGNRLRIEPCIPSSWGEFEIRYRYGTAQYVIKVQNPEGVCGGVAESEIDGMPLGGSEITLADDGRTHYVRVVLGAGRPSKSETVPQSVEVSR